MSRTLSVLGAATLLACGPQSVDAVSCPLEHCRVVEVGGFGGGGAGGTGGSGGSPAAGMGGNGLGALIHRYSFDATADGVEVIDSVQGQSGTLRGAVYGEGDGAGTVVLAGKDSNQYVDLPNHLLAGLKDVTFEAWVTWAGGGPWQRIFDFGEDETGVDGSRAEAPRSYVFLSCNPRPRFAFEQPPAQSSEIVMTGAAAFPTGALTHVAVVIDETNQHAWLYVDGAEAASTRFSGTLTDVYDVNNWLGRSQYVADPGFEGSFSEFRIYGTALSAAEVAASFEAGPDATVE
ncbi:MAG TPA: LamG domain-containing protein [Polyangiaceae bacterium]|nr:LamG domain-containing protein [Polyangiaceae bacterium]